MQPGGGTGWTQTNFPEYLQPSVGYIFWRLQSGASFDRALNDAMRQPGRPNLTDSQWSAVAEIANRNFQSSQAARNLVGDNPEMQIGRLFIGVDPSQITVGVRVTFSAALANGQSQEVSLLVNAAGYASMGDVLEQAANWVLQNAEAVWGSQYPIVAVDIGAFAQLSGIPWDNAVLSVG